MTTVGNKKNAMVYANYGVFYGSKH